MRKLPDVGIAGRLLALAVGRWLVYFLPATGLLGLAVSYEFPGFVNRWPLAWNGIQIVGKRP